MFIHISVLKIHTPNDHPNHIHPKPPPRPSVDVHIDVSEIISHWGSQVFSHCDPKGISYWYQNQHKEGNISNFSAFEVHEDEKGQKHKENHVIVNIPCPGHAFSPRKPLADEEELGPDPSETGVPDHVETLLIVGAGAKDVPEGDDGKGHEDDRGKQAHDSVDVDQEEVDPLLCVELLEHEHGSKKSGEEKESVDWEESAGNEGEKPTLGDFWLEVENVDNGSFNEEREGMSEHDPADWENSDSI